MDTKHEQTFNAANSQPEDTEHHGHRLTPIKRIVAAGTGAVLAATLAACGERADAKPVDTSSAPAATAVETTPPTTPTATPTETTPASTPTETAETAPTVESLELKADLPTADLAKATLDFFNDWVTAGATAATIGATLQAEYAYIGSGKGDIDAFAQDLAQQNATTYAEALFGPNWQSDGNAVQQALYQQYIQINAKNIEAALGHKARGETLASYVVAVQSAQEATDVQAGKRQILFDATDTEQAGDNDGAVTDWKLQRFTYNVQNGVAYLDSDGRSQ